MDKISQISNKHYFIYILAFFCICYIIYLHIDKSKYIHITGSQHFWIETNHQNFSKDREARQNEYFSIVRDSLEIRMKSILVDNNPLITWEMYFLGKEISSDRNKILSILRDFNKTGQTLTIFICPDKTVKVQDLNHLLDALYSIGNESVELRFESNVVVGFNFHLPTLQEIKKIDTELLELNRKYF